MGNDFRLETLNKFILRVKVSQHKLFQSVVPFFETEAFQSLSVSRYVVRVISLT